MRLGSSQEALLALEAVALSPVICALAWLKIDPHINSLTFFNAYSDVQKSVPVKLARLLPYITIGCCFDSHPRIDSVLQRPLISLRTLGERYR
jgi:hypothetical protein